MNFPIHRINEEDKVIVPTKNPLNFSMNNINFNKIDIVPEGSVISATKEEAEKKAEKKKLKVERQEKKSVNEFKESYKENESLLREVIFETDLFTRELKDQLDIIKNNKTLKNKFMVMGELYSGINSLIGSKLNAIKELDSIINNSQNMGIKKAKTTAEADAGASEEKLIMDLYRAMIDGRTGINNNSNIVMPLYENLNASPAAYIGTNNNSLDTGYNAYVTNRTPAQMGMVMDSNRNIQTIVRYNPNTGVKKFDVIDINTGQSLQGFERPNDMFLDDTVVDSNTWTAKNSNINAAYDVMVDPSI